LTSILLSDSMISYLVMMFVPYSYLPK